ncbi:MULTISPECIES: hypothetical protein [Pseudomonas syringae group]|uniref:Uncharacterized protein n=1 Tax=Pseudomonas meliae TaxID=86176 RepID=A0A0P9VH60_9PSED|nr:MULTISPECIES: hypothetical protein [Pseudomonas syringae group]KPX83609.1 hypothetical protein ALO64_04190 [Pseudomonas meliae]QOU99747.1 hypothetical protein [Pseudomonas syringae pv. actinidiae]
MELKISCSNVSQALAELEPGEALVVPCNGKTTQSTQSSIGSMLARRKLASAMFSQNKALIVRDEFSLPIPVIIVTRRAAQLAGTE